MNFWMAIDKATVANGCLFVAPGSHSQTLPHDPHPVQGRVMQADAAASLAALVPVELEPGDGASVGLLVADVFLADVVFVEIDFVMELL